MKRLVFALFACFALAPALHAQDPVEPDTTAPTISLDTPAIGSTLTSRKAVVSGSVDDSGGSGVREVRFRIEGSRKWRKAVLSEADADSTNFTILAKFRKRTRVRIYVRATDGAGNESDTIGRRYIISR